MNNFSTAPRATRTCCLLVMLSLGPSTTVLSAADEEPLILRGANAAVEVRLSENQWHERYLARRGEEWIEVAVAGDARGGTPVMLLIASNEPLRCSVRGVHIRAGALQEEFDTPVGRITRRLAILGESPWIQVTTRFEPSGAIELHSFADHFRFSQRCDWAYSPSVGGFNPDAQYKAPLILVQAGAEAFGLVPDLAALNRPGLKRCNHTLDLDVPAGPRLGVGFMPARLASHAVYALDARRTWKTDQAVENSYFVLVTASAAPGQAFREAVRFHWDRFGRPALAEAAGQQAGTDARYRSLALWDQWRAVVWEKETREQWLSVPLPDGTLGGGVQTRRWGPGPSVYLSSWFNSLRTSLGLALYARRSQNAELLQLSQQTVQLALQAPGAHGAFKCIAVPVADGKSAVWAAGDGAGSSTEKGFLGYDMSWTGYWLLRWHMAKLPGHDRILPRCQKLAGFFLERQATDGMIPTRFNEDGSVQADSSRTVKAETGPVALFLLQLYEHDRQPEYLAAARRALAFLEQEVIPLRQWYDYETFWSCSPRSPRFDERTQQWPANNLALAQTVAAYLAAFRLTGEQHFLEQGEALLDYLLLYQQCWTNPALENLSSRTMLLGGFTTQNSDAEWSDARQSQCGNILLDYYRVTGKVHYLERGVAALRAQFPISPSENWAHNGYGPKAGVSSFHWGTGSGMAGIELETEFLGDATVDIAAGRGVGVNGLNLTECRVNGDQVTLGLASPFDWAREPRVVFHHAVPETSYRLTVNGVNLGRFQGVTLNQGVSVPRPQSAEVPPVAMTPDETHELHRWMAAKFDAGSPTAPPTSGLAVLANFDVLCQNTRMGRALTIGRTEYPRGVFCHATSKVAVRLPAPGQTFSASVGVDSNSQTHGGRGSIVFSVTIAGKEAFRSKVMREGMAAEQVSLNLAGATEFLLEVGDAGDGIACDQADWAEAKVVLADGRSLWLGDLPIIEGQAPPMMPTDLPFSFRYGGQLSAPLLREWPLDRQVTQLDDLRTARTWTWTDPKTQLVLRWAAIEYHDFPTVEWTLHLKNGGATETPIISDLQALDARFERRKDEVYARFASPGEFVLNHHVGSPCAPNDYQPLRSVLPPKTAKRVATSGGRGSNSDWPYFNVEWPGAGVIAVVGWPGQWAASFTRDEANGLRVQAGQEQTHFKLLPGEEVRTPLIALQFWKGDRIRSQNIFRRWMLAHNVPQPGGQPIQPMLFGCSSHFTQEMVDANEANQLQFINRYLEERLKIDYWWMDAGWYFCDGNWGKTGTWEVDTQRFPRGLRAISDHAHSSGIKTIVWFEPERVHPGTWLAENHPEWILGGKNGGLLNLGTLEARQWLADRVSRLITDQGIDLYRQDFNMDPLDLWRKNDAPDRQGITEMHHVTGYLAYWDDLLRRHPGMLIDSCASGGRRNDLETLRRSVPLWRTDFRLDPVGTQCHSYGISSWIPLSGTGTGTYAAYDFRCNMVPLLNCIWDVRVKDADYDLMRQLCDQFRQVAHCYLGDYYPLTPYSLETTSWMGWQFDRPELGTGMVQVFRRSESIYKAADLRLRGLNPAARYRVRNLDSPATDILTGQQLMDIGLPVVLDNRPGAAVITYEKMGMR